MIRLLLQSRTIRYVSAGVASFIAGVVAIWFLEKTGAHYLLVVTGAFIVALIVSFSMQKFLTFTDADPTKTGKQFSIFFIVALCNLGAHDGIAYILYTYGHVHGLIMIQAIASVVVAIYSFFLYKHIVFKSNY